MVQRVADILDLRTPGEVLSTIVLIVPIEVTGHCPFRPRPVERFENELMNRPHDCSPISPQTNP